MEFTPYELYDLINRSGPLYLANADLSGAYLSGTYLRGAYLSDANLTDANLSGSFLSGAKYNDKTKWPYGFDPEAAGAILLIFIKFG